MVHSTPPAPRVPQNTANLKVGSKKIGEMTLCWWLGSCLQSCTTVSGKGRMSAWQKQLSTTRWHCQQNAPPVHTVASMPEAPTHSRGRDNQSCVITAATGVGFPLCFNWPHDTDTLHDELDRTRWILHGFHQSDVGWIQGVKSCLCCSQSWQSLCKVCFTFILLRHGEESWKPSHSARRAQPRRNFSLGQYPLNRLFTTLCF